MRIEDVCTRNVIYCGARASVLEVAQLMRNSHVGDVIVVEQTNGERVPIGIITDRDLVMEVMAKEIDPASISAGDLMSAELVTAGESETIYEIITRMRAKGVRRLPVVNEHGGLAGVITMDDLVRALGEQLTVLGRIVAREEFEEGQRRR
jgi:CBS domain-containing protein